MVAYVNSVIIPHVLLGPIRLYYNRAHIGSCYQSDLQEEIIFPKLANLEKNRVSNRLHHYSY